MKHKGKENQITDEIIFESNVEGFKLIKFIRCSGRDGESA